MEPVLDSGECRRKRKKKIGKKKTSTTFVLCTTSPPRGERADQPILLILHNSQGERNRREDQPRIPEGERRRGKDQSRTTSLIS